MTLVPVALAAALVAVLAIRAASLFAPRRTLAPAPPTRRRRLRHRQHDERWAQLADYLDALAREIRVGTSLSAAFVAITPFHPDAAVLLPARGLVVDGTPLGEALLSVRDHDGTAIVVPALACVAAVGGPAAATLDVAASVLRERAAIAADARAHGAQARLSARILTIVPLTFAAWTVAFDRSSRRASLESPLGAMILGLGLALNLVGWWWMRRITNGIR